MISAQWQASERILRRFKGLSQHLQADEQPLFTVPAIWDGGQGQHSMACDVIITNRRVFGYIYTRFPRERLFLDALPLDEIKAVTLRQKAHEPVFRELFISSMSRNVYVRAPRQKIERLYGALRSAIDQFVPGTLSSPAKPGQESASPSAPLAPPPAFGKQEIRASFERSPLAVLLLFVGGLILEIGGALLWLLTQSFQTGFPLFVAGLVAVATAILVTRQRR